MKRLLTTEEKRNIKDVFKANVVYRVINAAYKEQETNMETLHFSTEEIWTNCFVGFDKILKNKKHIEIVTEGMWNDIFCELRDDAVDVGRNYEKAELETATSCIVYSIVACLMATEDWQMIRNTEGLMHQIAEHSDLDTIVLPFDRNIVEDFTLYVKRYISLNKHISDNLDSSKQFVDPVNPISLPKDRLIVKNNVKKRLAFMSGRKPNTETSIMSRKDFNKMIEAVEYLIENNVVMKQETKIRTNMNLEDLRYTFYLVYKNEGKYVSRDLWIDFLVETFDQLKESRNSIEKHFSEKSHNYKQYLPK